MTFPDMTPEKWAMLGWIAFGVGFVACAAWFVRSFCKDDEKDKGPEGADKEW